MQVAHAMRTSSAGVLVPSRHRVRPPRLADDLIDRPRAVSRIRSAVERSAVVIVSAAAGSGKTTAVAQALAGGEASRVVAWLTLDRADVDPHAFLAYLAAALGEVLPEIPEVITSARRAGATPADSVELLVNAVEEGGRPAVLVLDQLERLRRSKPAWEIVRSLVRAPGSRLGLVLCSRFEATDQLRVPWPLPSEALIGDGDLATDVIEAGQLLAACGAAHLDPAEVVAAAGGWITGVIFEAYRSTGYAADSERRLDPLSSYFASQVVPALSASLVDFLTKTSVLPEVTISRARALGLSDVGMRFAELRRRNVPATWDVDVPAFRCTPRFREYLLDRLITAPDAEILPLRRRLAELYEREEDNESATTEYLALGDLLAAARTAELAIMSVLDRGDLDLARSWLRALRPVLSPQSDLTVAELMVAVADDDLGHATTIVESLEAADERDRLVRRSPRAAAMVAWCYLHQGAPQAVQDVLDLAGRAPAVAAVRYAASLITNGGVPGPPTSPMLIGGPSDGLVLIADAVLGRSDAIRAGGVSDWSARFAHVAEIESLRASGRITEALKAYEVALASDPPAPMLDIWIGPTLLVDADDEARARAAVERGSRLALRTGSVGYRALNGLAQAKIELRLAGDADAAKALLDGVEALIAGREYQMITDALDLEQGRALLSRGSDEEAAKRLRRATRSMVAGRRLVDLPAAAVYLAEVEWRLGDEEASDRAAELALESAGRLGSNYGVLQALRDYPAVASRRIDAVEEADSPWHRLGRIVLQREQTAVSPAGDRSGEILLRDMGEPVLFVDGKQVHPRIAKCHELVAFLGSCPQGVSTRTEILTTLFDGRPQPAASSYLRQTLYQLRQVLAAGSDVVAERSEIRLREGLLLTCVSTRFESLVEQGGRVSGASRMAVLVEALKLVGTGQFLRGHNSSWAEQRRDRLDTLVTDVRFDVAELAFDAGDLAKSAVHCDAVLAADVYREPAWRLKMRICNSLGDDAGVISAFRSCSQALEQLDVAPSTGTRDLLTRLRR